MKVELLKINGHLIPDYDDAIEQMKSLRDGEHVMVDVKVSRNPGNHKRFFVFLKSVFDMQEHFQNTEEMRSWLLIEAGYFTRVVKPDGGYYLIPQSMAWDKMEEPVMKNAFSNMIDVVVRVFDLNRDQLYRVISFS